MTGLAPNDGKIEIIIKLSLRIITDAEQGIKSSLAFETVF